MIDAAAVIRLVALATGLVACVAATVGYGAETSTLPAGFVRLRDVDATIVQDIRYATAHNFTQAPVPGYFAGECIVLREVANALKLVQADLRPRGMSLKVYDCYRPVRAVKAFMLWVQNPASPGDARYWPRTLRGDLHRERLYRSQFRSLAGRGCRPDSDRASLRPESRRSMLSRRMVHAMARRVSPISASTWQRPSTVSIL